MNLLLTLSLELKIYQLVNKNLSMAKRNNSNQQKTSHPIGKSAVQNQDNKKDDFYQKHKSTIWTIVVLIILTYFFIVNNTRKVPEEGAYPPNYIQSGTSERTD